MSLNSSSIFGKELRKFKNASLN